MQQQSSARKHQVKMQRCEGYNEATKMSRRVPSVLNQSGLAECFESLKASKCESVMSFRALFKETSKSYCINFEKCFAIDIEGTPELAP
jgi:hypothetical protein